MQIIVIKFKYECKADNKNFLVAMEGKKSHVSSIPDFVYCVVKKIVFTYIINNNYNNNNNNNNYNNNNYKNIH